MDLTMRDDLVRRKDVAELLKREWLNGPEENLQGLKMATEILKYAPSAKETLWQAVKRKLSRKR